MQTYTTRYKYRKQNTTPQTILDNKYIMWGGVITIAILYNILAATQWYEQLIYVLSI